MIDGAQMMDMAVAFSKKKKLPPFQSVFLAVITSCHKSTPVYRVPAVVDRRRRRVASCHVNESQRTLLVQLEAIKDTTGIK
jgi:hypothetical protein